MQFRLVVTDLGYSPACFCSCSPTLLFLFRSCYVRYSILHFGFRRLQPNHSPIHVYTSTHSGYYMQFIISKPLFSIPFADWFLASRLLGLALHLSVAACGSSLLPFNRYFDWFRCAFSNSNFTILVVVVGVAAVNFHCFTNVVISSWYAISTALFRLKQLDFQLPADSSFAGIFIKKIKVV